MQIVTVRLADGRSEKIVLRHQRNIEHEHALLQWLQSAGVAAPRPLAFDESGRTLMLSFVDGESRYDAVTGSAIGTEVGKQMAKIHAVPITPERQATLDPNKTELGENTHVRTEAEIRAILEPNWPIPESGSPVFIHGDFWPGNMLWRGNKLVGVIDWEDAKLGNRYQDLAISRFDCCFIFGRETMLALTKTYNATYQLDPHELALWDLYAALRAARGIPDWAIGYDELGRPDLTEEVIWESHRWFLDQALNQLKGESK